MVNVQLTAELRETISILKKRYAADTMAEALTRFIAQYDREAFEAGRRIAEMKASAAGKKEE